MNKIKKLVNAHRNQITKANFNLNPVATAGGVSVPLDIVVQGLEGFKTDPVILEHLRDEAVNICFRQLDARVIDEVISAMHEDPQSKAWAVSVLWYNFSPPKVSKDAHFKHWRAFYDKWNAHYSYTYESPHRRDEILLELGLPQRWIARRRPIAVDLKARCVTLTPKKAA